VKDTVYVVISFFLKIAAFFFCITLVSVLSSAAGWGQTEYSAEYILGRVSSIGAEALFAAVFLALLSVHFRIVRKPGKKPLTFILVFAVAFCFLYCGLWKLNDCFPAEKQSPALSTDIDKNTVLRGDGVFIWVNEPEAAPEKESSPAGPVLVMKKKNGAGSFHVYAQARAGAKPGTLKLSETEEVSLAENKEGELPFFLKFFIDDIAYITSIMRPRGLIDINALYHVFIFVFFGLSLWAPAKLSRWPLFNQWFALAAMWLVFSGTHFLGLYIVPELVRFPTIAGLAPWLPAVLPGFCGFVFFFAGFLSKPIEKWKREMRYE